MIALPKQDRIMPAIRLDARRSLRDFADRDISLDHLSVVLFAAQGRRLDEGKRLAPSAGARYPLEISVAVRRIKSLQPGLYRYNVDEHALGLVADGENPLAEIAAATFEAPWLAGAAAALLISAVFERTTSPYANQPPPGRAERYVWLEAGHAAQNAALAVAALELATVFIGGFDDDAMARAFRLPADERSIGVMPIGCPVS
jgi:SagB-type dehydrogenase family enzyme